MAQILVADDNQALTRTIQQALVREGHQVLTAHSGQTALSMMQQHQPDVILLDIVLPDLNGFEVCRQARALPQLTKTPIIFLSVKQHIDDVLQGFEAGADDYVTKPFDLRELTARIEAVLRHVDGNGAAQPAITAGPLTLEPTTHQVHVDGRTEQLTPREYDLLYYMMQRAGTIVSIEQALQDVWGYAPEAGDPDLVRAHVRNLRLKIEPDPTDPIHIKTIPRRGYLIPYQN